MAMVLLVGHGAIVTLSMNRIIVTQLMELARWAIILLAAIMISVLLVRNNRLVSPANKACLSLVSELIGNPVQYVRPL